jgi:hypothetical protein
VGLVLRSTQVPPVVATVPGRHWQVPPPAQYWSFRQMRVVPVPPVAQPPQAFGSSSVSVQALLQVGSAVVVPGRFGQAQAPVVHDA